MLNVKWPSENIENQFSLIYVYFNLSEILISTRQARLYPLCGKNDVGIWLTLLTNVAKWYK
jgi:hypothetical protein